MEKVKKLLSIAFTLSDTFFLTEVLPAEEQTKSDRALNNTIALAGIVLGISGLSATAISVQQPQPKSYADFSFLSSPIFIWSFGLSFPFIIFIFYRFIADLWRR